MPEDCAFCEGRYAAEAGIPADANPHPVPDADPSSRAYQDSDWWLWDLGYGVGAVNVSTLKAAVRERGNP